MSSDAFVRLLAGLLVLLSITLAHFISPWWLVFTGFVGLNLIQSAFTGFCPPQWLARRLGWVQGPLSCGRRPTRTRPASSPS